MVVTYRSTGNVQTAWTSLVPRFSPPHPDEPGNKASLDKVHEHFAKFYSIIYAAFLIYTDYNGKSVFSSRIIILNVFHFLQTCMHSASVATYCASYNICACVVIIFAPCNSYCT